MDSQLAATQTIRTPPHLLLDDVTLVGSLERLFPLDLLLLLLVLLLLDLLYPLQMLLDTRRLHGDHILDLVCLCGPGLLDLERQL